MSLFQRIGDIISANLSEMVEKFEDPEKMLKQAIREMEESIDKATHEAAKSLAGEKRLVKELAHNENEARQWQSRAEKAVEAGDDQLARRALVRKGEHDKLAVALKDQVSAAGEASGVLKRQLDGMQAKLAEAKRNLATLVARKKAAEVRKKIYSTPQPGSAILGDEAFRKFDKLREKVEQAEAEAEALAELRGFDGSGSDESSASSFDQNVEDELATLKKQKRN